MEPTVVNIGVRTPLYERILIVAETEDIEPRELIDHVLRSYIEAWTDQDGDDEEDPDEDTEEEEEEPDTQDE